MNLDNVDINKLPSDVRKTFKKLQVMHAEKQIQGKASEHAAKAHEVRVCFILIASVDGGP